MRLSGISILILSGILALSSCIEEKKPASLEVGDKVPEFSVMTNTGQQISNKSLLGARAFIMFFHTGCPDCRKTMPEVQKIYDEYLPQGVRFVLISREESQSEIESYWQENGYTMPYCPQETREVYEKFAQSRIPRVYICDENGIIKSIFTDNPNPEYSDLKSAIDLL